MWKGVFQAVVFAVFVGVGALATGCSSRQRGDVLTVGLQAGYPPYEYVDEHGAVIGFDVGIAQKLADFLHKELVIREMGFDSLILALKSHKIDLIISGMSITADRLKEIDLIPYHGEQVTHLQLLFWGSEGCSMPQLKGKRVAVQSGTFQEQVLHRYIEIEPKLLENTQELVMDIKYGKSSAILVEPSIGNELRRKYPQIHSVDVLLSPEDQVMGNGIGVAKDRISLKEAVERGVSALKKTGQMAELEHKWFHD